jgi:hypothetical protein
LRHSLYSHEVCPTPILLSPILCSVEESFFTNDSCFVPGTPCSTPRSPNSHENSSRKRLRAGSLADSDPSYNLFTIPEETTNSDDDLGQSPTPLLSSTSLQPIQDFIENQLLANCASVKQAKYSILSALFVFVPEKDALKLTAVTHLPILLTLYNLTVVKMTDENPENPRIPVLNQAISGLIHRLLTKGDLSTFPSNPEDVQFLLEEDLPELVTGEEALEKFQNYKKELQELHISSERL